jgi:hypothetical protein
LKTSQTPSTTCFPPIQALANHFPHLFNNNQAFCLIGSALLESQSIKPPNPHLDGHLVAVEAKLSAYSVRLA